MMSCYAMLPLLQFYKKCLSFCWNKLLHKTLVRRGGRRSNQTRVAVQHLLLRFKHLPLAPTFRASPSPASTTRVTRSSPSTSFLGLPHPAKQKGSKSKKACVLLPALSRMRNLSKITKCFVRAGRGRGVPLSLLRNPSRAWMVQENIKNTKCI